MSPIEQENIPKAGSVWIDRDSRMKGRRVTVLGANEHFVKYRGAIVCRSRTERFLEAFRPAAVLGFDVAPDPDVPQGEMRVVDPSTGKVLGRVTP